MFSIFHYNEEISKNNIKDNLFVSALFYADTAPAIQLTMEDIYLGLPDAEDNHCLASLLGDILDIHIHPVHLLWRFQQSYKELRK